MAREEIPSNILRPRFGRQEDYVKKTRGEMREERIQEELIVQVLNDLKEEIDAAWRRARGTREGTFLIDLSRDLTCAGLLSRKRVADIIRQWTFETYEGYLGLEYFHDKEKQVQFRFKENPEPPKKAPTIKMPSARGWS